MLELLCVTTAQGSLLQSLVRSVSHLYITRRTYLISDRYPTEVVLDLSVLTIRAPAARGSREREALALFRPRFFRGGARSAPEAREDTPTGKKVV